jgi:alkanesulfonate monooxygenase SsuD/methylene tetrahydromethanopterin reductase-like flavin-dependent oxidoreductase (luciferase family)
LDPEPQIGVVFPAAADPADLAVFARRAEELGFDAVWLIEDCFLSGGLTMAATALAVTGRISVGIGLLPAPVRNPAIAAMEIATLARMHPGRFEVALGHGVREWMAQIGALPADRVAALGETTTAVRALLSGTTVTTLGAHVHLENVRLDHPPTPPPPVLIGTTGPQGLALAANNADGVLLPEGCGPSFVEWARTHASVNRCVVYAWLCIDADPDRAAERLVPTVESWLDVDWFPHPQRLAGASEASPRALIPEIAVCGDADDCAAAIRRFAVAGADMLVLSPLPDDYDAQLAALAQNVMAKS